MWMSKSENRRAARSHYVVDGAPLCSRLKRATGEPLLAEFKCSFAPEKLFARRCSFCSRALPHYMAGRPLPTF